MESFEKEQAKSSSLVAYLQEALERAALVRELGKPNEFRTAVCCHLLDIVVVRLVAIVT